MTLNQVVTITKGDQLITVKDFLTGEIIYDNDANYICDHYIKDRSIVYAISFNYCKNSLVLEVGQDKF
jgi:hypothetical protein